MRRAWVYASLVTVGISVCLICRSRLMGETSPVLSGQEAIARAAGALGVRLAQMRAIGEPTRPGPGEFRQDFVVDGKRVTVEVPRMPGTFRVEWPDAEESGQHSSGRKTGSGVDIATAQRTAETVVRRRFPDMNAMNLRQAKALPMGVYMFVWGQSSGSGAYTGNEAFAWVDTATGRLVSYTEKSAPRAAAQATQPPIGLEDADRVARPVLDGRVGQGHSIRLDKSALVLSSPFGKDGGPVWELSYVDETPSQQALSRLQFVVIDAVTGREITDAMIHDRMGGGTR